MFYPGPKYDEGETEQKSQDVLKDIIRKPCQVNSEANLDDLCVQYSYISINKPSFVKLTSVEGYAYSYETGERPTQVYQDEETLKQLDFTNLALLNKQQVGNLECVTFLLYNDGKKWYDVHI